MQRYKWPLMAALSLALVGGVCSTDSANTDTTLAQDTLLGRDLQLANTDTAVQPQLQDVPPAAPVEVPARTGSTPSRTPSRANPPRANTPPRTTTPEPAPVTKSGNTVERGNRGSEGTVATIPSGTAINLTSNDRVCTNTHRAGDRFTATVTEAVQGTNGAVIPAGARVVIQVSSVKRSENANDPVQMGFAVQTISYEGKSYPINAEITNVNVQQVRESTTKDDAKKVIGGAVAGAVIGQILGKDTRSTVIGAATGAAAGTAVAMGTANFNGCVAQGGKISIRLNAPATVTTN